LPGLGLRPTDKQPALGDYDAYHDYFKSLPINDTPEVYGLHDNASISFSNNTSQQLLSGILATGGSGSGGGGSDRDKVIEETARDLLAKTPPVYNLDKVMQVHPVMYEESMNTVLIQVCVSAVFVCDHRLAMK